MILWLFVLLLTLLPVASHTARPAFAATLYTVNDLGLSMSFAWSLNNPGQVVGRVDLLPSVGDTRAVLWDKGVATQLPSLGGTFSSAVGIDDSGHMIVGRSFLPGDTAYHAVLWNVGERDDQNLGEGNNQRRGAIQDLGTLDGPNSFAQGLNNRGQIVGYADLSGTVSHAFLRDRGGMHDLGSLGGMLSEAHAINDAGQVLGDSSLPGEQAGHAFLWARGVMTDLGTLGGPSSVGSSNGINNQGQAVGGSDTSIPDPSTTCAGLAPGAFPETHAFVWASGVMHDLGTFPGDPDSGASAINDSGQVVGGSSDFCGNGGHVDLWQNGTVSDLNALIPAASGWLFLVPTGINARGQITGYGCRLGPDCDTGVIHGLLLTPGTASGEPGAARSEADTQAQMQRLPARVKSLLVWHRWHRQGMGEIPLG
jgi:probable HAF family extracellular repeat protein